MATNYPGALDTTTQLPDNFTDATPTSVTHEGVHNNISDAIIAIETALGTNPQGGFANVSTALATIFADAIIKTPSAAQVIQPSADVVPVAVKRASNTAISDLQDWRDYNNNLLAYIDYTGVLNAQALRVAGSLLSSANLSDVANIAFLNSPAFTGNPTAPTQTAGNNSTRLATTSFVATAIANAISSLVISFNTQTANYVLVLADAGKMIEMNLSTANTVTIPANASVAFPIGTEINFAQLGGGTTTIAASGGVTLRSYNNNLQLAGQYAIASAIKRGTDDWWVAGNLVP